MGWTVIHRCTKIVWPRRCFAIVRDYSFRDAGSDSFFGDFLSHKETSSRPEAGTPTLPSRTISLAVRFRPYSFLLALPSDRSVEPSSEMPANNPRERE
jgi:hypothetical protein